MDGFDLSFAHACNSPSCTVAHTSTMCTVLQAKQVVRDKAVAGTAAAAGANMLYIKVGSI
jgi:hypothetical protein